MSVSSQRDSQRAMLTKEERELQELPDEEIAELTVMYRDRGLSPVTAQRVAEELRAHDALAAHAEVELGLDPADGGDDPWAAALSSAVSFTVGAALPLLAVLLVSDAWRIPATFGAGLVAPAVTGALAARLGGARVRARGPPAADRRRPRPGRHLPHRLPLRDRGAPRGCCETWIRWMRRVGLRLSPLYPL